MVIGVVWCCFFVLPIVFFGVFLVGFAVLFFGAPAGGFP